jgi:outer membrane immunogenic protein
MKLKIFAAAALITLGALGSANAADLSAPAYRAPPPPLPVYNWTGCYVGGGGGYAFWQQDSFVTTSGGTAVTASQSNGGKGWFGQGQVGCDYQFTAPYFGVQTVIGAFGDFEGGSINGSSTIPIGLTGSERESSTWAVGGRAGVLVTPRFLTYFDGGYTQARFDGVNYNFAIAGGGPSGVSLAAQTYNGWFIGSGFEYAFDWLPISGLFLKTEFRYSQYGGNGTNVPLTGSVLGIPVTGAALNSQKATEFISTELVWRFNWFGGRY